MKLDTKIVEVWRAVCNTAVCGMFYIAGTEPNLCSVCVVHVHGAVGCLVYVMHLSNLQRHVTRHLRHTYIYKRVAPCALSGSAQRPH